MRRADGAEQRVRPWRGGLNISRDDCDEDFSRIPRGMYYEPDSENLFDEPESDDEDEDFEDIEEE